MKIKTIINSSLILISLLIMRVSHANAQGEFGFGYHHILQKGTLIKSFDPGSFIGPINYIEEKKESYASFGLQYMYNYPIHKFSDNLSVCLKGGVALYGYYEKNEFYESDLIAGYQFPAYAGMRLGHGATKDSDMGWGFGAGGGVMVNGFTIPDETAVMVSPALMAEIKHRRLGLRFEYMTNPCQSYYNSYTGPIPRLHNRFLQLYLTMNVSSD